MTNVYRICNITTNIVKTLTDRLDNNNKRNNNNNNTNVDETKMIDCPVSVCNKRFADDKKLLQHWNRELKKNNSNHIGMLTKL